MLIQIYVYTKVLLWLVTILGMSGLLHSDPASSSLGSGTDKSGVIPGAY